MHPEDFYRALEQLLQADEPGATAAADDGTVRGLLQALKNLLSKYRPGGSDEGIWAGTPYPVIRAMAAVAAEGNDLTWILNAANEAFSQAREARENKRHRTTAHHLYYALAYFSLAASGYDATATLTNLAGALGEIGDYGRAVRLQELSLRIKQQSGSPPENIARSLRLLASSHVYLGDYVQAAAYLRQAKDIMSGMSGMGEFVKQLEGQIEELERKAALGSEIESTLDDPVSEHDLKGCIARAGLAESRGDMREAVVQYARAISSAAAAGADTDELAIRLKLAELLYQHFRMFKHTTRQFAGAADVAEKLGDVGAECSARYRFAVTVVEMGDFSSASRALEAAFAAVSNNRPADQLWCEIVAYLSFTYLARGLEKDAETYMALALEGIKELRPSSVAAEQSLRCARFLHRQDFIEHSIRFYLAAIEIAKVDADPVALSAMYKELAYAYYLLGMEADALATLAASTSLAATAGDKGVVVRNWVNRGWAHLKSGDYEGAKRAADTASALAKELDDPELEETCGSLLLELSVQPHVHVTRDEKTSKLTAVSYQMGETISTEMAIESLRAQINAASKNGETEKLPDLHAVLGQMLERDDRFREAAQHYLMALRISRAERLLAAHGKILHDYGVLLARSGRIRSARRAFAAALACKDKYGGGNARWTSLLNLAQADTIIGTASSHADVIVELEATLDSLNPSDRGQGYLLLAQLYMKSGRIPEALERSRKAIEAHSAREDLDDFVSAHTQAIHLHLQCGELEAAWQIGDRALREVESQRAGAPKQERWKVSRLATRLIWSLLEVCFALGSDRAGEALQLTEHAKARSLIEHYGEELLPSPADLPPNLAAREKKHILSLRQAKYANQGAKVRRERAADYLEESARSELREFWDGLPSEWQEYTQLRRGTPPDVLKILQRIAPTAPVHYIVLSPAPHATYVWRLDETGRIKAWDRVPVTRDGVSAVVWKSLEAMSRREAIPEEFSWLSAALLQPHLSHIPPGTTICLVPGGQFLQMPFGALPYEGGYLIERNPLAVIPSLSLLAYWQTLSGGETISSPLVLGDSLEDLRWAEEEARHVAEKLSSEPLIGRDVLRHRLQSLLPGSDLLHVACHAFYDEDNPLRSGFLLADRTVFSARDLLDQRFGIRLAVLSGCESGLLDVNMGDELAGLSSSLLQAGIPSVVSTLWRVADRETRDLILEFYEEVIGRGGDLARALQMAQCKTLSRRQSSHPYYWAAFQLWGRWDRLNYKR